MSDIRHSLQELDFTQLWEAGEHSVQGATSVPGVKLEAAITSARAAVKKENWMWSIARTNWNPQRQTGTRIGLPPPPTLMRWVMCRRHRPPSPQSSTGTWPELTEAAVLVGLAQV